MHIAAAVLGGLGTGREGCLGSFGTHVASRGSVCSGAAQHHHALRVTAASRAMERRAPVLSNGETRKREEELMQA